jgi:cob(I)alamin adenosyltransferase
MKIYTKRGDKGETSLYDGSHITKSSPEISGVGELDELNSRIGLIRMQMFELIDIDECINDRLISIQNIIMYISTAIATPTKIQSYKISDELISLLEQDIDSMTDKMPKLSKLILPAGNELSCNIHLCRTQTRKCERLIIGLSILYRIDSSIKVYMNRLSDYFFTLARYVVFYFNPELTNNSDEYNQELHYNI